MWLGLRIHHSWLQISVSAVDTCIVSLACRVTPEGVFPLCCRYSSNERHLVSNVERLGSCLTVRVCERDRVRKRYLPHDFSIQLSVAGSWLSRPSVRSFILSSTSSWLTPLANWSANNRPANRSAPYILMQLGLHWNAA